MWYFCWEGTLVQDTSGGWAALEPGELRSTGIWMVRCWLYWPFLDSDSFYAEEPGGLQSMGSQRIRYDWVTEHAHTHFMQAPRLLSAYSEQQECCTVSKTPNYCLSRSLTSYLYNSVSNILSTLLIELGPSSGGKNLHFAWQAHWMRRAILYIIERTIPNYIFPVDHVICFIFYISKWINIKFPKFKTINNPLWKRLNKMEK